MGMSGAVRICWRCHQSAVIQRSARLITVSGIGVVAQLGKGTWDRSDGSTVARRARMCGRVPALAGHQAARRGR